MLRAGRTLHHPRVGLLNAQTERGQRIGSHVDRQDLNRRERQRNAEQREDQVRDQLGHVVGQDVSQELPDVAEDRAPLLDRVDDAGEVVVQQHHVGRFLGHVGARDPHRDSDVRALERRRVVHAVAGGRHDVSFSLQRLDDPPFLIRADTGEDDFRRVQRQAQLGVGERAQLVARDYQRVVRAYETDFAADRLGGEGMVTGDHDHGDAGLAALAQRLRHFGTGRIFESGQSREDEILPPPRRAASGRRAAGRTSR